MGLCSLIYKFHTSTRVLLTQQAPYTCLQPNPSPKNPTANRSKEKFWRTFPNAALSLLHPQCHFPVFIISVMLSPFNSIRPKNFLVFFLRDTSSASSRTRFMYSSKPMMRPSILISFCSNSHIWILDLLCKNLKIRLMGWVIIRCTLVVAMAPDSPQPNPTNKMDAQGVEALGVRVWETLEMQNPKQKFQKRREEEDEGDQLLRF